MSWTNTGIARTSGNHAGKSGNSRKDLTDEPVKFLQVFSYFVIYDPAPRPIHITRVLHTRRYSKPCFGNSLPASDKKPPRSRSGDHKKKAATASNINVVPFEASRLELPRHAIKPISSHNIIVVLNHPSGVSRRGRRGAGNEAPRVAIATRPQNTRTAQLYFVFYNPQRCEACLTHAGRIEGVNPGVMGERPRRRRP